MLGENNDFEKAALYTYSTFYLLAALAGNSVILLATSRRYEAIKLDRVTVTIIQHIAFCDVGNVFFSFIPGFISFIYGRWVLGRVLCWARVYIGVLFALTGSLLVCGLNVSKLSILLNPLGTRHVPTTTAKCHLVVGFLWLVSAIWPVSQLVVEPVNFYFDYRIMICMYAYSASVWKWLGPLCLTVVIILPSIIAHLYYTLDARYCPQTSLQKKQAVQRVPAVAKYPDRRSDCNCVLCIFPPPRCLLHILTCGPQLHC